MDYDSSLLKQTQDPMSLEMAAFRNDSPHMSKEDFGIITTTQEGILSTLQIMNNEIVNHTDIILKKTTDLQTLQPDKDKEEYKKKRETTTKDEEKKICLLYLRIHRDTVFLTALKKLQKKENKKPAIKSNECFNCGEEGHWANKCPNKLKKGYCYTFYEEGHFTKDCPHYDSGSKEKQKAQRI